MDIWCFIKEIVLLLGLAFLFGLAAQRLKQSAIVGYLLAGAILGPTMFNRTAVQHVAELGVALLLFSIGLEFSFGRLKRMGVRAFMIALLQILATLGVFSLIFSIRGPTSQAIALGAVVTLSSTAIVLRVLLDRTEIDSMHGRNALAVLLTQDIAVVPLVLLVTILGHGGDMQSVTIDILKTMVAAFGLAALFYLLFYLVIPRVLMTRGLFANRELVVLLAITIATGSAWGAHAIGLSPALGAFIAGLLLAESPFATQIRSDIGSLRTLFVTLFFASIGMLANPIWFLSHLVLTLFWLVVVFAVKAIIVFAICRLFRFNRLTALATGITLAQIGEFSFVLAAEAHRTEVMARDMFDLIVTVTILSMFLAPYMAAYASPLSERILKKIGGQKRSWASTKAIAETPVSFPRIFIIGFGPAGQRVAEVLMENNFTVAVVELSPKTAAIARQKGLVVHMVDATNSDAIVHIGIRDASLVVVTVPDPHATREIINNIRLLSPKSTIFARSRYHIAIETFKKSGAAVVIDEETTVGDQLARAIMESSGGEGREALAGALTGEQP